MDHPSFLPAVALVVWLLASRRFALPTFDWKLAAATFAHVHWHWVALSLIPMLGTYWGRALRWAVFLKPLKPHPSMRNLLSATVVGFTAITLFGRPGEFVRPYLIARKEQVPVTSQFAAWVLERIFDLLMALLLFAFALSRVQSSDLHVGEKTDLGPGRRRQGRRSPGGHHSAGVALAAPLRRAAAPATDRRPAPSARQKSRPASSETSTLSSRAWNPCAATRPCSWCSFYSALEWVLICLCYWCLAQSFSGIVNLGLVDVLILMGFVSFGSIVQIPGVGGGMQVVSVLVLTELFGIRLEMATAFAIYLWAITFVAIVPMGLFVALKEGLDWHSLKRIGREASE